jgi:hypothetical protein
MPEEMDALGMSRQDGKIVAFVEGLHKADIP